MERRRKWRKWWWNEFRISVSNQLKYRFAETLLDRSGKRREFVSASLFWLLFVTTKSEKRKDNRNFIFNFLSWNKKLQKIQVCNENPKIEADKPKFKKLTYIPFFFATLRNCRSSHLHFSCSDSFEFLTVYLLQFFNGFSLRTVFLASELKNFRYFW